MPNSGFKIPDSGFQIPDWRFQIPDSRFKIPDSRFKTCAVPGGEFVEAANILAFTTEESSGWLLVQKNHLGVLCELCGLYGERFVSVAALPRCTAIRPAGSMHFAEQSVYITGQGGTRMEMEINDGCYCTVFVRRGNNPARTPFSR
jgi:hypothetical protein